MSAECTTARSNKPSVSTRRWRFLPLIFLPASKPCGSMQAPLFGALHALAIDDGSGGTGLSFRLLAACDVERIVNAIQHTITLPPYEVTVDRAVRSPSEGSAIGNRCSKYTSSCS